MKLSEVKDEWSNNEVTLENLFNVQAARSLEFVRYFNYLIKQHPEWPPVEMNGNSAIYDSSANSNSTRQFRANITRPDVLPKDGINKLCKLRDRMQAAKKAYENAGGDYD